jgi:murein DD-endopeptidase MepM/ murein hydrolase activator NlpD/rare lipoprotein A (peptidoglycan hydrolase)
MAIDYIDAVGGRLSVKLESSHLNESAGNMSIGGQVERTKEDPYGVVSYMHDTNRLARFVDGLRDIEVIQFAAPFNNIQRSVSPSPNPLSNMLEGAYNSAKWMQALFPSEVSMLMKTKQLKSLETDLTNFDSTVQNPIKLYEAREALLNNQIQAKYHKNKDGSFPEVTGAQLDRLQHSKLLEGLYSKEKQAQLQAEFKEKGFNVQAPTGKVQTTTAMFTDTSFLGISITGSGGALGSYEDYTLGFENPNIIRDLAYFRENKSTIDYYEREPVPGVTITGNLSIYKKRVEALREANEIQRILGKGKDGLFVYVASPSMDWNEQPREHNYRDTIQRKNVGAYIKELQKTGTQGILSLGIDKKRINIPAGEKTKLLQNAYIGDSRSGRRDHGNMQYINLRGTPKDRISKEAQEELARKGLLDKAVKGISTLSIGQYRIVGDESINQETTIDLNKVSPAYREAAEGIAQGSIGGKNFYQLRKDVAKEGIAGALLQEFYTPTFSDRQKRGWEQEGLLPNMPLSMPASFFRYFEPGTKTRIYTDRFKALTGYRPEGAQGYVLRTLDEKLSDPGLGNQINYMFRQRDLYEVGKGAVGTLAAGVGRFIDTATGFYTMQTIKARESGQLSGSLRKLYESRQRDPYEQTEKRGFFENLTTKAVAITGSTATAMASYFGVTHAYTMAKAAVEQVGVDYVLDSIASGKVGGASKLFLEQLLDESHSNLITGANIIYNAESGALRTIENTGKALDEYFDLSTRSSLKALQLDDELVDEVVKESDFIGGIRGKGIAAPTEQQAVLNLIGELDTSAAARDNTVAGLVTKKLEARLAEFAKRPGTATGAKPPAGEIRGWVTEIYKELGIHRDAGTIDLGRGVDHPTIAARVQQPAGFVNIASVRRMDTGNLHNMFIPLLDEVVFDKNNQQYRTAKENLLRLAKASPILSYKQTANNLSAASDLKIYNYGYERIRQLAEVFDELAEQLPANPLMWIKPIRQVFMANPLTGGQTRHSIEGGAETTLRYTFKDLIGPGFTGLINLQGQITRELVNINKVGLGKHLEGGFDLIKQSKELVQSQSQLVAIIQQSNSAQQAVEMLEGFNIGGNLTELGARKEFIRKQSRYDVLLRDRRRDYEELLKQEGGNPAFSGLRKGLLGIGTVLLVDRLFDTFVMRPQGVDLFDSILSDVIGSRSPAVEGREGDAAFQSLYDTEYSNALPNIVKYPSAAAGFFIGGHMFPSYEVAESSIYTAMRSKYGELGEAALSGTKFTLQAEGDRAIALGINKQIIKTKFGTAGALLGASAALIGSQLLANYVADVAKPAVRGFDNLASLATGVFTGQWGRWREPESGLDVDPVKGSAASVLAKLVHYSVRGQAKGYRKGGLVTAEQKTDTYLLGLTAQSMMQSDSKPPQLFYSFATQIASPFFQFASVGKVDPAKNTINLNAGLQLFPLLGAGLMLPSPLTPKVTYTSALPTRMVANYLKKYHEGVRYRYEPNTLGEIQEREAFHRMEEINKLSSMMLGGGVNLSLDTKPLVYLAMLGGLRDLSESSLAAFEQMQVNNRDLSPDKATKLYKELSNYETLFHAGRTGFNVLDTMSRAAYSLPMVMPNYLVKSATTLLGGAGRTQHILGPMARRASPYLLAFGILGASFRFNDKAMESELVTYADLQKLFKTGQYEGLNQKLIESQGINLTQTVIGSALLGAAISSSGAFESVRNFGAAYDRVQKITEQGGRAGYIDRQKHKLYSMWMEHLAEKGTVGLPLESGVDLVIESINTPSKASEAYEQISRRLVEPAEATLQTRLRDRQLIEAAREIDIPLVRTMPTRLGMLARRVAPLVVGAMVVSQMLATTDGFKQSPWMSLIRNLTDTGAGDLSAEQRAMLTKLGIKEPKYRPKDLGQSFRNIADYLVGAAMTPFGGNTFGLYQDNPNPFSPILGPLGVSLGSQDDVRPYLQSQSVAADISGSLYLLPAMSAGISEAMNLGPLLKYAGQLETHPKGSQIARALIRGAGLRTRAAKFKGGPSQREMRAASSPELQMALVRRYDRLRQLSWQTAGEHQWDVLAEFHRAGRILGNNQRGTIPGAEMNATRPATTMIYDTLGKLHLIPVLNDGTFITPRKNTETELLKFFRNLMSSGAGYGQGAAADFSADVTDTLIRRSQDRGGVPVLSFFSGLFQYAFNSFYDKNTEEIAADSNNVIGAGLMAGAAIALGASFVGTTFATGIQLVGALAALSDQGNISDVRSSIRDLRQGVKKRLRRSTFYIDQTNDRLVRPDGHNRIRALKDHNLTDEAVEQINQALTGQGRYGGYSPGNALETIIDADLRTTASKLVNTYHTGGGQTISTTVVEEVDALIKSLDTQLTVVVGGQQIHVGDLLTPTVAAEGATEAVVAHSVVKDKARLSTEIYEVLTSGKFKDTQQLEIERILLDHIDRGLAVTTADGRFEAAQATPNAYQPEAAVRAEQQAAAKKAAEQGVQTVEAYDPSVGYLRSKIQAKGYSGLMAEGAAGAMRAAGELINLKAYYEILSYTAAMGSSDVFDRRRSTQAAAQNTIQAFGMIIPMQYALKAAQASPGVAITAALTAAVIGGAALGNKQVRDTLGNIFKPVFSFGDKYVYKPAVQGLAGIYDAVTTAAPFIPQVLRPIAAVFDPIFSNMRSAAGNDPALSMLANFFVPEGVEQFYQRNAEIKGRTTPWGEAQEFYSNKELGQYYLSKMASRRRRGRSINAGIDSDLLHPFMQGKQVDIQYMNIFADRYLGGDGRIMEQFQTDRQMSNLLLMAIQRRQGMIDQYAEGSYMRKPYTKENVHHYFSTALALSKFSYAQTGSFIEAPINQAARGIGTTLGALQYVSELIPSEVGTKIKQGTVGAGIGFMVGAQLSHLGKDEGERRQYAAIGGSVGATVGGAGSVILAPSAQHLARRAFVALKKDKTVRAIAGGVATGAKYLTKQAGNALGMAGRWLNKAAPYLTFGALTTAAVYTNYDFLANLVDGDDRHKKGPLYNPLLKMGVSAGVGATTTLLGFTAVLGKNSNILASRLGKATGGVFRAGGKGANVLLLTGLTNFLLTNNVTGALPKTALRSAYTALNIGREEDFENYYSSGAAAASLVTGVVTPPVTNWIHGNYKRQLTGLLTPELNTIGPASAIPVDESQRAMALVTKLQGDLDFVEGRTSMKPVNTTAKMARLLGIAEDAVVQTNLEEEYLNVLSNKQLALRHARSLVDANLQHGFIHEGLRSIRAVARVSGHIGTLGLGYFLKGLSSSNSVPLSVLAMIMGGLGGFGYQHVNAKTANDRSWVNYMGAGLAGGYAAGTAAGLVTSFGSGNLPSVPLSKYPQRLMNLFARIVKAIDKGDVDDAISTKALPKWLDDIQGFSQKLLQDPRSAGLSESVNLKSVGTKVDWFKLSNKVLPVAAFSIDVLNLYTSVNQINNLQYGRSQAQFQQAYSSYQSTISTIAFSALMGIAARNTSFSRILGGTLQAGQLGYKRGLDESDNAYADAMVDNVAYQTSKRKQTMLALGAGGLSALSVSISALRANPSFAQRVLPKSLVALGSRPLAQSAAQQIDDFGMPVVQTAFTAYGLHRVAKPYEQRYEHSSNVSYQMAQRRGELMSLVLFATGSALLARKPSTKLGAAVTKYIPGLGAIGAGALKDLYTKDSFYQYEAMFLKSGITNDYAKNIIATKAAESTDDNLGITLGLTTLASIGLLVATKGKYKGPILAAPAVVASGLGYYNYSSTIHGEINERKQYEETGGLKPEEVAEYQEWRSSGELYPSRWKNTRQGVNYQKYKEAERRRITNFNLNYNAPVRRGYGFTPAPVDAKSIPDFVLRAAAMESHAKAIENHKANPVVLGASAAGLGLATWIVGTSRIPTLNVIPAAGKHYLSSWKTAVPFGTHVGTNLIEPVITGVAIAAEQRKINDLSKVPISVGIAGEMQAVRQSVDITTAQDKMTFLALMSQLPLSGETTLGSIVRGGLVHGIGHAIFESNIGMVREREFKQRVKVLAEARAKGVKVNSALLSKAVKAQATTDEGHAIAATLGIGQTATKLFMGGNVNAASSINASVEGAVSFLGIKAVINRAIGKRRFDNVVLNRSTRDDGRVLDSEPVANVVKQSAGPTGSKSSFEDDYLTNPYMLEAGATIGAYALITLGSSYLAARATKKAASIALNKAKQLLEERKLAAEPSVTTTAAEPAVAEPSPLASPEPAVSADTSAKGVSTVMDLYEETAPSPLASAEPPVGKPSYSADTSGQGVSAVLDLYESITPQTPAPETVAKPIVTAEPPSTSSQDVINKVTNPEPPTPTPTVTAPPSPEPTGPSKLESRKPRFGQIDPNLKGNISTGKKQALTAGKFLLGTSTDDHLSSSLVSLNRAINQVQNAGFASLGPAGASRYGQLMGERQAILLEQRRRQQQASQQVIETVAAEPEITPKPLEQPAPPQPTKPIPTTPKEPTVEPSLLDTTKAADYLPVPIYESFTDTSFLSRTSGKQTTLGRQKFLMAGGYMSTNSYSNVPELERAGGKDSADINKGDLSIRVSIKAQTVKDGKRVDIDNPYINIQHIWNIANDEYGRGGVITRDYILEINSFPGATVEEKAKSAYAYFEQQYARRMQELRSSNPAAIDKYMADAGHGDYLSWDYNNRQGDEGFLFKHEINPTGAVGKVTPPVENPTLPKPPQPQPTKTSDRTALLNIYETSTSGVEGSGSRDYDYTLPRGYGITYGNKPSGLDKDKFVERLDVDFKEREGGYRKIDLLGTKVEARTAALALKPMEVFNTSGIYTQTKNGKQLKVAYVSTMLGMASDVSEKDARKMVYHRDYFAEIKPEQDEQVVLRQLQAQYVEAVEWAKINAPDQIKDGHLVPRPEGKFVPIDLSNVGGLHTTIPQQDGGFIKPVPLPTSAERQVLSQQRADRVRRGQAKGIDYQMMLMDMVYGKAKESVTGVISKAKEISQSFVSGVGRAVRGTANQAWDGWSIFDRLEGLDARFGNQGMGGGAGFWTRFGQSAKYELSGRGIVEGGFGIGRNAQTGKVGIQGKGGAMALAGMGLQLADDILTLDWSRKNFAKSLGTVAKNQATSLAAGVAFGLVTAGLGALALSSVPALAALGIVGSAVLMGYGIYSLADQGFKVGGKAWEKFVLKRKRTAEEQKVYEQQSQVLSMGFGVGTFVYAGYNQIKSLQGARRAASVVNQAPVVPTVPVRQAVDVIDDVAPRTPVNPTRSGSVLKTAGKAVKVASTMYSVYQIGTGLHQAFTGKTEQAKDQGRRQAVREIGGLIGMRAGAKVGGYVGRAGGTAVTANPTGAIVGDVAGQAVGGYIGYQGGSNIAEQMYDNAMEMMYGKMNQRQRQEAVDKEVKRRSAGSQYNLEAIQGKEQKVAKQIERPRAWWRSDEEDTPWWKKLLQTIGKGVEALGNFLTRTKNAALDAADALSNWATGGVPLSSDALISGNLRAANSRGTSIIQAAQILGINPLDLATIVEFESDGNPHIRGGAGGNYIGLIQFGPNERKKYGYHSKMTFEEQMLGPVVNYFKDRFKSAGMSTEGASLEDLYTTVLAGNPKANRGSRDAFGTSPRSGVRKMTAPGADRDIALQKYFIVDGTLNAPTGFQVPSGARWASSMGVRDAKTLAQLPQRTGGNAYGMRIHPTQGRRKLHAGEDYAFPIGTPLSTATPAVVVFAGMLGNAGNTVVLRHSNGTYTRSLHMDKISVKAGDVLMPNQMYGTVGTTGDSTGPHLHFEEGSWDSKTNRFKAKPPTDLGRKSIQVGGKTVKVQATPPTSPQDYFNKVAPIQSGQTQSQQIITRTERKSTKVGGVTHYAYTNTTQKLVTIADSQVIGKQKQQLNETTAKQVNKMLAELKAATGVDLWILSGYRSVEYQQELWNKKKREGKSDAVIAKSLAIPGFSEHHTGDAFDISLQGQANLTAEQWASNPKLREARAWLDKNQSKYGFETSFLPGNKENVVSEPWHLRYVGPGSEYARQIKTNVTTSQQVINQVQGGTTTQQVALNQQQLTQGIEAIRKKYGLQSIYAQTKGGVTVGTVDKNKPAVVSSASMGKLPIALLVPLVNQRLKSGGQELDRLIKIDTKLVYEHDGVRSDNELAKLTVKRGYTSIRRLTQTMLKDSSNTAANILIKEVLGGDKAATQLAKQYYKDNQIQIGYYGGDTRKRMGGTSAAKATTKSLFQAWTEIRRGKGAYFDVANQALSDPGRFKLLGDTSTASKIGVTSSVLGNAGTYSGGEILVFDFGSNKDHRDPNNQRRLAQAAAEVNALLGKRTTVQVANPSAQYQQQQAQRNVSYIPGVGAGRSRIVTSPASGVVTNRNDPDSREFVTGSDIQIGGIRNGVPIWNPIQGLTQVKPNSFQGRGRGRSGKGWGNLTRYRIDLGNNRVVEMLLGHGDRPFEDYMGQGGIVPFALLGYQGDTGHATGPHATTSYKPVKGTNATAADARLVERMVQNAWTSRGSWVRVNGEWRLVKLNQAQQMGLLNGTQPSVQPSQTVKPQPVSQPARSQQQLKQSYQPAGDFKRVKASYYGGTQFHGKRTASGEIYNQNALTVAVPRDKRNRPIIPFGTVLEVINPANGKRVLVKVTDTGSFGSMGRGLDLSVAAATALGTIKAGVANVQYRIVKPVANAKPQEPKLELPTTKPSDWAPLVPKAAPPPAPKPKPKFNIFDPRTWLRSEGVRPQQTSNPVATIKSPVIEEQQKGGDNMVPRQRMEPVLVAGDLSKLSGILPPADKLPTASNVWGMPGHRPAPTGNYHDYGKRPPQREGPIWGQAGSRPEQTGSYQDWERIPQRDRTTPPVPTVPGHRPEIWDILPPLGNIPGTVDIRNPKAKPTIPPSEWGVVKPKAKPKVKATPTPSPARIEVPIGMPKAVLGLAGVLANAVGKNFNAELVTEAQELLNDAAQAAVSYVEQIKEAKAAAILSLEHPQTLAGVRPSNQRGQEVRTKKQEIVASYEDGKIYIGQQIPTEAVQAQLANRDIKVPVRPEHERAAAPRMMNTKAD